MRRTGQIRRSSLLSVAVSLLAATLAVDSLAQVPAASTPSDVGRSAEAGKPVRRLRLVLVTPCIDEPFFAQVTQGARDAARLMDVDCDFWGTQAVDIEAQVAMVRKAISDGCDGIALNIIDPTAFDGVIAQAARKGIPVIAFNVNAQPHSRVPTVAQNLYDGGREAAFAAAPLIPDRSRVLMTGHDGDSTGTDPRHKGIRDGLKDKQLIWQTVVTSGSADEVEAAVTEALQADPTIKVVIATGLANTEGAGRAIEKSFRNQGYTVVGFDTSPEVLRLIKAGIVSFTVDQQPYVQGFYPIVQLAMASRSGLTPTSMDAGAKIIRAGDVDACMQREQKRLPTQDRVAR